jgi:hypothetical protein
MLRRAMLLPVLAGAFIAGACDSPTGTGSARLTLLLTDAPHEYLSSAVVDIGRISIRSEAGETVLTEDGGVYDLLQLQNGVTAALTSTTIEPGSYSELRMVVREAELTLKDGFTFTDGTTTQTLRVPSGAQSGIKVKLFGAGEERSRGVDVRPGETVLVVDFDVSQNFVMQGSAVKPAGIRSFSFTPVLRASVRDVAGSISGTVTAPQGVAVEGLSVTATRTDAAPDDLPATTLVKEDGTFTLHFLPPGTYDVTVSAPPAGHTSNVVQRGVGAAEHVTGVELVLTAS